LDNDTGDVYQKTGGTWGILTNIEGPQGTTGATGPSVTDGQMGLPVLLVIRDLRV